MCRAWASGCTTMPRWGGGAPFGMRSPSMLAWALMQSAASSGSLPGLAGGLKSAAMGNWGLEEGYKCSIGLDCVLCVGPNADPHLDPPLARPAPCPKLRCER
jgi:hypothetical protein